MYLDIILFAVLAAFLLHRLRSALGTRHGGERKRPNPFAKPAPDARTQDNVVPLPLPAAPARDLDPAAYSALVDETANADGRVATGLAEIAAADATFEPVHFVEGAREAFGMVVTAFARGDRETLRDMLSPKLYADFDAAISNREAQGQVMEFELHRIRSARVTEAHLGGTMAYVTVDFDVEETMVTRAADGTVVEGAADRILNVEDIWTFTRDTRSGDPNWLLIETRSADKP